MNAKNALPSQNIEFVSRLVNSGSLIAILQDEALLLLSAITKPGKFTFCGGSSAGKTGLVCIQPSGHNNHPLFFFYLKTPMPLWRGSPKSDTKVCAFVVMSFCHIVSTGNTSLSSLVQLLQDGEGNTVSCKLFRRQGSQPGCGL